MKFDLGDAMAVLERTPATVRALLDGLPPGWVVHNEGPETWSPYDVVGHLIHGERTDWIPRAKTILEHGPGRAFEPFDRFAQFRESKGKTLGELLDTFAGLRRENLATLRGLDLQPADFARQGMHPELGPVTLGELLATWVVHDLGHIRQIARVMARQYAGEVGAWGAYLPVLAGK